MRSGSAFLLTLILGFAAASHAAAESSEDVAPTLLDIEKLRAAGDMEAAAKQSADLLAKHPESLEAHLAYQDVQLALGNEKELLARYREAVALPEASADAHYLCARLLRGNPAIGELRAALKVDPRHFWAACGLGVELTRTRSFGEARTILDEASKMRPDSAVPINALGRMEEARGRRNEAEKLYRAAIELDPSMSIARVNLGLLLVAASRQADAMPVLQEAVTRSPKDPMPLLGLGMAFMSAKDPKNAVDAFKRAVSVDSRNVTSLNMLANAYIGLEQNDLAEEALQQALKVAPGNVTTKVNLAYVRVTKSLLDEAMKFATEAIQADDKCAEAHYILGLIYDHQVLPKKAEAEFHRAENLDEDNPAYARALGALAASIGNWTLAIGEYTKVVKLTGASGESMMELAGAYSGAGKAKAAASTYDQIVAAEPTRLEAWLQLGIVCGRDLKEYKRGAKALHEYVNRGGKDPRVAKWIAWLESR